METLTNLVESTENLSPESALLPANTFQQHARTWMALSLLLTDFASLLLASLAAVGLRMSLYELVNPPFYWSLVPLLFIFPGIYALRGLYPAVGLSPVEELRRLTTSTSAVFLFITAVTFWIRTAEYYSRLVYAFAWVFALVFVPLGRWLLRILAVKLGTWGEPVAIIGSGPQAQRIAKFLLERMRFGLRPVVFIDCLNEITNEGLPLPRILFGEEVDLDIRLSRAGVNTAILITSEMPTELQDAIVNEQYLKFHHLILISNLNWIGSLGVTPHDLEGYLGLEIRQNLLNPWERRIKRLLDVGLSLLFGLLTTPAYLLIALLIRLESPGPIFYSHIRIGKGERLISVWKFRTMVVDADRVLDQFLKQNPLARDEWANTQKIKDDPRVTRVGRLLRKYSLDELPQLWNVLKGEMSLVGPRPIVVGEVERYQEGFTLYKRVLPGITGLWQVSGRTDVSYQERVRFDEYYVRNWSVWLDIYIILRTFWVVIQREGAY
jgi:Undecaprenyl-phosphate galactose phosphotransferase WbaP